MQVVWGSQIPFTRAIEFALLELRCANHVGGQRQVYHVGGARAKDKRKVRKDGQKAVMPGLVLQARKARGTSTKLGDDAGYRYLMKAVVCDWAREVCR